MAEFPGKPVNLGGVTTGLPQYSPVDPSSFLGGDKGGMAGKLTVDEMIANIKTAPAGASNVPASALPIGGRFTSALPYADTEEMAALQQSSWDKWGNGFAKMTGTAATTFLNGTVGMIVGTGAMIKDGRFASLYDNEFNRNLDDINKRMEDLLPNYYSHSEQDALWYSPQNILTANFWSDKVVKNLGFSIGALAGGVAWGSVLKSIGITNRLVQAGKGLETVEAVEKAISTAPKLGRFGAISETLSSLQGSLKPLAAGALKNSDRAIISVMGTMGEAGIESLQNMNQYRDTLIDEYVAKYGVKPTGDDLSEINEYADKVGNFTWGMNVALLSATNYIQLPKILNTSKTAEKRMINEVVKDKAGKYVAAKPLLEQTLGKTGRLLDKIVKPASLLFAPVEAFEEGAQFSIQTGVNDYFNRAYKNQEDVTDFFKNVTESLGNVLGEGVEKALTTKEGLESILIGGISGGIQTSFSPFGENTIKQQGLFGTGGAIGRNTDLAISSLNKTNLGQVLKDAVKYAGIAVTSQKMRQAAIAQNDTLEEKDYEKDYTLAYVLPRVKYGKVDSIKEELGLYKQQASTTEGFQELKTLGIVLENETMAQFIQRLGNIEKTADSVAKTYDLINDKYSSLVDTEGKRAYSDEVIDKLVYTSAKIIDYDQRLSDLSGKLSSKGVTAFTISDDIIEGKTENYKDQVESINKLKITSDEKEALISDLNDVAELALRRQKFLKEYDEIKSNPNNFKDTPNVPKKVDAEGKPVETVTLKTKTGEEEVNIGEEYFLGKVVEYDKSGKEVYRFPKLTILGENEDGTIKIKDSNGNIKDVSKSVLEDYKLGKVSDTLSNKKAKFFMDHINTIFEFNFGKGKKVRGRLEYSPKDKVLHFVYKGKDNKIKRIEVTGDQFVPKEGFASPMISAVGEVTSAQQKSLSEFGVEKDERTAEKKAARLQILSELFDELTSKQDKTKKLIAQKEQQVKDIIEELTELEESLKTAEFDARSKKALRFKSQSKKALTAAMQLSRTKDQLEQEIESLKADEQELEFNASYVADLAQNIDQLPTDSKEFLEELKDQRSLLEDLILETGKNINSISKLIDNVQSALDSAISYLRDLLGAFEKAYPKAPLALGEEWVSFLKDNPNFLKKNPLYKEHLQQTEELIAQVEDLDITPNERTINELKGELQSLQKALEQTEKEIKAKDTILSKFKEVAEKYKEQKQQEAEIAKNKALLEKLVGTHSKEQEVNHSEVAYQAEKKKDDNSVINGTVAVDDGKPHQKRANVFGINLPKLKNRANLRAIEITNKTQDKAGIPGLIQHLISGTNISPDTVVAVVFVQDEGNGNFSFVNENGEVITDDLINNAIYQVRPTEKLTMNYSMVDGGIDMQTMFRDSTPKEIEEELRKRYTEQRAKVLESTELQPMKEFNNSFGILEYEQIPDSEGKLKPNYGAKNAVLDTELISEDDLSDKQLLEVATLNDPTPENGVSFKNAIGRVFLRIPGIGMLKLNTSKITKPKAESIFEVINRVAKNINEDPTNGGKNSEPLFAWLKTVIYWGIQKDPSTKERKQPTGNSIWFEEVEDVTRLFIGKEGNNFVFTPSSLEANKAEIISALQEMYHNVSNSELKTNKKYREITGFNKEGEAEFKTWDNYQTYLLSKEGRNIDEVPLTTPVLSIKGTDKTNRKGIYFVLQDNIETEVTTKKSVETKEGVNVYTSPKGKKINYSGNTKETFKLLPGADLDEVAKELKKVLAEKNPDLEEAELRGKIASTIAETIINTLPSPETKPKRSIFGTKPATIVTEKVAEKVEEEVKEAEVKGPRKSIFSSAKPGESKKRGIFRLQLAKQAKQFKGEEWNKVEAFIKKAFPNIPVYRVKNALVTTNGKQAWGALHKGAIYLSQNAEIGTSYHEVFEAVWKALTPNDEQQSVIQEFKNRKGSFINSFTGETIKYSEAGELDIKEEIAEEFRDYILNGKIPTKPTQGRPFIIKLFSDIANFIKTFFTGEKARVNTANLFEKIGEGYYAKSIAYDSQFSFAKNGIIDIDSVELDNSSLLRLNNVAYVQQHELMQHMTYVTLSELIKTNSSLFGVDKINKTDLYNWLKNEVLSTDTENPGILQEKFWALEEAYNNKEIPKEFYEKENQKLQDLYINIEEQWDKVIEEHTIYLKQYSIEFDEHEGLVISGEEKTKENEYDSARKQDAFRKANPAIKMLLATIPELEYVDNSLDFKYNSIGGISTLPLDKVFITLKNNLYNSIDIEDMMVKLREFAKSNINYRTLYTRLTKNSVDSKDKIDFSKLSDSHDIDLISAFYKAMKAQNAEVKIVYLLPSGEVEIGDAHLADATRQLKQDMFGDVLSTLKTKNPYVVFEGKEKGYNATSAIKNLKLEPGNLNQSESFLKALGITFSKKELETIKRKGQLKAFEESVNGIKKGISEISGLKDINKYTFNLEGRLMGLAAIKASLTNPDFESTYFNISGEKTQTYIGTNLISDFYDYISKIKNIKELENTPYAFLLTDKFAQNSLVLNSIFNPKTGNKIEGAGKVLSTGIVEGIIEQAKGKSKESSNSSIKERLIQELNLNHKGWFLNLVPGDASIEWMINLFKEDSPFVSTNELSLSWSSVTDIFKDYFISEVNTAREDRTIPNVKGRESRDLRFFKAMLDKETHDKIVKNTKDSAEKLYNDNKKQIDSAIINFVKSEADEVFKNLKRYDIVKYGEEGLEVENLSFAQEGITEERLVLELQASQVNYMIANIEMHKLIYSDPYFYKDELKRIKNFNSPAQALLSSPRINEAIHSVYNKKFSKGQLGYTDFIRDYLVSATLADINSFIKDLKGYESWEETDGGGIITLQAYRNIRIRSANWNEQEEAQYQHDIKYERLVKSGASQKEIEEFEKKNPKVKSAYTPIKPIVRGSKRDGKPYNDILLDKFALTPFSFRILHQMNPESNALKHYQKMIDTGVDYTVFNTGRKVGAKLANSLYNEKGEYNNAPFLETSDIPFNIMSIQTEVPSKDKPEVTQGSQVTKLATMDFMDAGVPIDFKSEGKLEDRFIEWMKLSETQKEKVSPVYKMIKYNEELLKERIQHGYDTLLNKLGIKKEGKNFVIQDRNKLLDTLTSEIYKREVNDNIVEAFKGFKSGQVVLEATPSYQQIRNILYSISNKQITRPTISGGMKVQVPSTLLESVRAKEEDGKYTSDILKFYTNEDGERVCEVMVGRWFKSDLSDTELLDYLNKTEEGKKILSGIGFRIPTQKQNSIDVFRIKQFLPEEFGDSVIIPSALVKKVGSDFDIDKLSMYFKNTYTDLKGQLKLIPFLGYGQKAKDKFAEMYDNGDFLSEEDKKIISKWVKNRKIEDRDEATEKLFKAIWGTQAFEESYIDEVLEDFLSSKDSQDLKNKIVNEKYRQSLENEYIQSLEDITSHPLNYDKLITPNSADQLKDLSKEIVKKLGLKDIDYSSVGNMLNRNFMERLRNAFVRGKYAIGIAATAQTNNAQNQRSVITIDIDKLDKQSKDDQKWLGDGLIKFKNFNKIEGKPTLSLSKNAAGQLISDIIGQFIDGYVDISKGPWIMELGATPNTASTWLFLIKLGVPIKDVAYFMNQPIIKDHLQSLENAGYSWIFNENIKNEIEGNYGSKLAVKRTTLPDATELSKMIGKSAEDMSDQEKAMQGFIFEEFFKYSKLAEQLFHIQQGTNFDTANLNDPYIVFKKKIQLEKAKTMMISSADDLLKNSFVGKLKDVIFDVRDAFSTILISDKPGAIRSTLEQVLLPYVDSNDRDFMKISQKAVFDLFDWAVQTNQDLNTKVQSILLGTEDKQAAAQEIMNFVNSVKEGHPLEDNYIIKSIKQGRDSINENKPHNLYIAGKNNKTYDQNNVIYGFAEIKQYLESEGNLTLYTKLVDLAVLQSGLSNSRISFTQLLPYEDFKNIYNETLSILDKMTNLQEFVDLNVFERNNWNNPDIVPAKKSQWIKLKNPYENYATGRMVNYVKTPEIEFLPKALKSAIYKGKLPQLIQISKFSREGNEEFVALSWEKDISKEKKQQMRKKGDYSYIQKGLFKKVYGKDGLPLPSTYTTKAGKEYVSFIFKPVNAWGDSFKANEFYRTAEQSKIDNGFMKVKEVEDIEIENILVPETKSSKGSDQIPDCA